MWHLIVWTTSIYNNCTNLFLSPCANCNKPFSHTSSPVLKSLQFPPTWVPVKDELFYLLFDFFLYLLMLIFHLLNYPFIYTLLQLYDFLISCLIYILFNPSIVLFQGSLCMVFNIKSLSVEIKLSVLTHPKSISMYIPCKF